MINKTEWNRMMEGKLYNPYKVGGNSFENVHAIPLDNPKMTDKDKCISCMHCVAVCPKKARNYSKLVSFIAGLKMKKVCSGRKENKLYL